MLQAAMAAERNVFDDPAPITLIDGKKLVELLIEHGIGVRKKAIELWELDASAFEDDSDEIDGEES